MSKELQIGLWGTVGSGKTTYLTMLLHDVINRSGFRLKPLNKESRQFLTKNYADIQSGKFPESTKPAECADLAFKMYCDIDVHRRKGLRTETTTQVESVVLKTMDAAGEWYRNTDRALTTFGPVLKQEGQQNPIETLVQCDGIICLLDTLVAMGQRGDTIGAPGSEGTSSPTKDEFFGSFLALFQMLEDNEGETKETSAEDTGYLRQAFAFCLSKVDVPAAWPYRDNPEAWAKVYLPTNVKGIIDNYVAPDRRNWYGVSAIGTRRNAHGEEESAVGEGVIVDPLNLTPFNLLKPIGWLVATLSDDKRWLVSA